MSYLDRYRGIVDDWSEFAASLAEPLPTCIVANSLRTTRESLASRLDRRGVKTRALPWADDAMVMLERNNPGLRYEYMTGLYNVQEEAAVIPVKILDPQPGERVLDLCAAPGNKTAQMAMAMRNRGTVIANDRSAGRHRATRSILDRLGLYNVFISLQNGTNFPRAAGTFDRVLVDAPCSCEGTSRKHSKVLEQEPDYTHLAGVQRGLLRRAFEICEPGGRVVYSTCTYAPEENEQVIDAVLRELPYDPEWLDCRVPEFATTPGLTSWAGEQFDPRMERAIRVWPHLNDTGGFFVAAFTKPADVEMRREAQSTPEIMRPIEPSRWIDPLVERFGWTDVAGWSFFEPNNKSVCLTTSDFAPPPGVKYGGAGLTFLRKAMAVPKITTSGAMLVGPQTTAGVVDLEPHQMDDFLRRRDIAYPGGHGGNEYVLVRCEGVVAGVGRRLATSGLLESLYPGAWALADGASAFEDDT